MLLLWMHSVLHSLFVRFFHLGLKKKKNTPEERNPGAPFIPFWPTHGETRAALDAETATDMIQRWEVLCTRSEQNYRLYISHWDHKGAGQKWGAPVHAAPRRWGNQTRRVRGGITFLLLIHLHRFQVHDRAAVSSPRCLRGTNENKQEGQGKIKIQKYIFMFIFIYIYIFTRYVSTKRKHPKFQNRQSVFFFSSKCVLAQRRLKETLILIQN